MKEELRRIARVNGERGRVLAARVALLARLYSSDPVRNRFMRHEVEHLARRVVYHLRQVVIVDALIERMERKGKKGSRARLPSSGNKK